MTRIEITKKDGKKTDTLFIAYFTDGVWVIESELYDEEGNLKEEAPTHKEFDYVIRRMKEVLFD